MNSSKPIERRLVTSRSVFVVTLLVAVLTIISVWLFGMEQHRSIYKNSLLSTSMLSMAFFLFLTIGLYRGIKLRDNIGKLTDRVKPARFPDLADASTSFEFMAGADSIEGLLVSIVLWIVAIILIALLFWLFGTFIWTGIILFMAMLYWIFFRALRLVFKNSNKCRGNLLKSMAYGLGYTVLYNCWIYAVILTVHYTVR